jgi:hypothetical protein
MVKTLAVLLALCAVAHADEDDGLSDGPPTLLGIRIGAGRLPVFHEAMGTFSLGVGLDHPIKPRIHMFGEYEYVWLSRDEATMQHGSAHRALCGLRATLAQNREHNMREYFDLEGGGGMSIVNDTAMGTRALQTGFAGVRAGFDIYSNDSPSRVFEIEILVRALFVPEGSGVMGGLGMQWGD